jgi:hypothetical protein
MERSRIGGNSSFSRIGSQSKIGENKEKNRKNSSFIDLREGKQKNV